MTVRATAAMIYLTVYKVSPTEGLVCVCEVVAPLSLVIMEIVAGHEDQAFAGLPGDFEFLFAEGIDEHFGDVLCREVAQRVGTGDADVARFLLLLHAPAFDAHLDDRGDVAEEGRDRLFI